MQPKSLSNLEQEVMNIVWKLEKCSVRNVLERLNRNKQFAYTTVMTIMTRLVDKGVLNRKLLGSRYLYEPKLSREKFVAKSVHNIFTTTISSLGQEAAAYFVKEIQTLNPKKRKKLLQMLDE